MITIVEEKPRDIGARERLLDRAYGEQRFGKPSEALRRGRLPAEGLALVAKDARGDIIGTVRLWNIVAGGVAALLLGPLAVDSARRGEGVGAGLMRAAIAKARAFGHGAILLVGDAAYYERFGFSAARTLALSMPGRVDRRRFLSLELTPGWLDSAAGRIAASGQPAPKAEIVPFRANRAGRGSRGGLRLRAA